MYTKYFDRYLKQKSRLPEKFRSVIEIQYSDRVIFYALSDMDKTFKASERWVVLGDQNIYLLSEIDFTYYSLSQLKCREEQGSGVNNLSLLNSDDEIVETIWYGRRQAVLFSQLKYLLEEGTANVVKSADEIYQEVLLKPILQHQNSNSINKKQVVWRLLSYLRPYRKELTWGTVGALGATLVSLLPAYLIGKVMDEVIRPFQAGNLSVSDAMKQASLFVTTLALIYIAREFFIWLRLKRMSVMGEKVARDLRRDIFSHVQSMDMDFFSSKSTGSIISRVSSDTDRIWDFVAFGVIEVSIALMTLFGLAIVLIGLDPLLGTVMTLPVPLVIYAIFKHGQKMQLMFLRCWRKWAEVTAQVADNIPGIAVVKSFNQERKEIVRFNQKNEEAIDEFCNIHESWTKFWPSIFLGIHLVMVLVWALALPRLLTNSSDIAHMSAGTFVSFLLYMTMFTQPIEVIGQLTRMINRASSSAYRIFEVLDTRPTLAVEKYPLECELQGEIEFKDVLFSYDGIRNVLKGINFKIKAGEMVGLVGTSGSGKTTITKLINRFYDVTSGQVLMDGVDVKSMDPGHMRRQIAVVHQDPYLFHGTIVSNIIYGKEDATLEEVIWACKVANAHEFIMNFTNGYDTIVGERGQTLSGGERQRISIARAILNDPKILILDEATSAVDTETERKIQDALDKLTEGRTVIAIAHRLSTLRKADRVFVVKAGEVKEEGTHQQLMDLGGEYKKLQDMQLEMFNLLYV